VTQHASPTAAFLVPVTAATTALLIAVPSRAVP
jgi:hypothetical protein